MNKQELAEIRRRFNPDKNNIDWIRGCYVNEKREIVSMFSHPLLSLPQEEAEKYLAIFKRTLSGIPGKNLVDIVFRPDQVMEGEAHGLLTSLVKTALKVDQAVEKFFGTVIENLELEGNYLILLMHDSYDVPFKGMDENKVDQGEKAPLSASEEHLLEELLKEDDEEMASMLASLQAGTITPWKKDALPEDSCSGVAGSSGDGNRGSTSSEAASVRRDDKDDVYPKREE